MLTRLLVLLVCLAAVNAQSCSIHKNLTHCRRHPDGCVWCVGNDRCAEYNSCTHFTGGDCAPPIKRFDNIFTCPDTRPKIIALITAGSLVGTIFMCAVTIFIMYVIYSIVMHVVPTVGDDVEIYEEV